MRDLARCAALALTRPDADGDAVNVGTGVATSVLGVGETLARGLGVDVDPEVVGQYRAGDIRHCYADVSHAREVLGYEAAVRFEDGVAELVAWVREQEAVDRVDPARAELERRGLAR